MSFNCLTGRDFTKDCLIKLKRFITVQQEVSLALLEAKHLGICKITTYVDPKIGFKNLDLTKESGVATMRTVTILTREDLKGIL